MLDTQLSCLSNAELESRLTGLATRERADTAELVRHLSEFDARKLYLGAGFSSLFVYCCDALRLSESEAYNRIEVARAVRRFPRVLEMFRDGLLSLTTARLLAPHLTEVNQGVLLAKASGKRKRDVEELLAAQFPRPAIPTSIRKLPVARPSAVVPVARHSAESPAAHVRAEPPVAAPRPLTQARRPEVSPLSAEEFLVKFTARASTRNNLRRAQDLLRHALPSGDVAEIFDRALTLLVRDLERRRFSATDRPRTGRRPARGSRNVGATVKRAVAIRDGERCAFIGKGGRRCNERGFVEFHHVDPYALDPAASVAGISLRCQAHNKYEGTLYFGTWPGSSLVPERVERR